MTLSELLVGFDSDHSKLPKLLLQLELNLPWKAVKDGFDKTRPQFVERLAAVKTPADAVNFFPEVFCMCRMHSHACAPERAQDLLPANDIYLSPRAFSGAWWARATSRHAIHVEFR